MSSSQESSWRARATAPGFSHAPDRGPTGSFVNPFQAGHHRRSAPVVPQRTSHFRPDGAESRPPAPMKLLETALITAADALPGVVPTATEARVRGVLAAPPSSAVLAVAFASLVDDPAAHPDRFPTSAGQRHERERLFVLMERLARPGARLDEPLLSEARAEIRQACLRPVPPDTTDPERLFREAQGFREQAELGGEDAIEELFTERREEYERTGRWRGTLPELRACFWHWWLWEERVGGALAADRTAVHALYRQVRAQWGELSEDVERALEWFRLPRGLLPRPSGTVAPRAPTP
jgi:hypothetical protein